ncbi:hypothetical protein TKK_0016811 [Trichogramma kaykai]|uniref:Uncharacterized protein n=1 Tax=Trichogramma kaykai TaxID=54128 RepID=A0ABD2W433_9HYME
MPVTKSNDDMNVQVQKLLLAINDDLMKLKTEIASIGAIFSDDGSALPKSIKMMNSKLLVAAKEIGVDLDALPENFNEDEEKLNDNNQKSIDSEFSEINEKLTQTIKSLQNR